MAIVECVCGYVGSENEWVDTKAGRVCPCGKGFSGYSAVHRGGKVSYSPEPTIDPDPFLAPPPEIVSKVKPRRRTS